MELGAGSQTGGHTRGEKLGGRTKQTEAAWAKSTVPLRYFICVCLFLFFFLVGKGDGLEGRQKNKIKEREKKKHDSSHPLPPLAPGLSR